MQTLVNVAAADVPLGIESPWEPVFREAVERLDRKQLVASFAADEEWVVIPSFLPETVVAEMVREARSVLKHQHRTWLPFVRRAGTVPQHRLLEGAPMLVALYRSPAMLELASELSRTRLLVKTGRDSHAATLYVYQHPGDHIRFHYDDCGCEETASYTAILGLVNDTRATVHFQLFKKSARPVRDVYVPVKPGALVFFCGSKAYHRVTPLGRGEERIVYSFAYVREGQHTMSRGKRLYENVKDAVLYFGPRGVFQKNY